MRKISKMICEQCGSNDVNFIIEHPDYDGLIEVDKNGNLFDSGQILHRSIDDLNLNSFEFIDGECLDCGDFNTVMVYFEDGVFEKDEKAFMHFTELGTSTRTETKLTKIEDINVGDIYFNVGDTINGDFSIQLIQVEKKAVRSFTGWRYLFFSKFAELGAMKYENDQVRSKCFKDELWLPATNEHLMAFEMLELLAFPNGEVTFESAKLKIQSAGVDYEGLFG